MYKHNLKVFGEYLAQAQSLPANATHDGNGGVQRAGGTMAAMEAVAVANQDVALANGTYLQIIIAHADSPTGGFSGLGTVVSTNPGAAFAAAAGKELGRLVLPSNTKAHVKAMITTTDPAASGKVDVFFGYLPR